MKRIFVLFAAVACLSAATPASSQVVLDISSISCKDFAAMEPGAKALVAAWIGGWFSASRNLNVVQEQYMERNLEKVGEYCKHHKTSGILADMEKIGH
jgi:acid stress chaperone HdeB